ncbi:hypothetical protein ABIG06_007414 [Bradyrhizobium sp. USDA 326]|uniref:hypothetical protein n=1 Tax=Bradyrhizobium sp. USDA 326 TaxID=3377726 RepID=UPI003C763FCB
MRKKARNTSIIGPAWSQEMKDGDSRVGFAARAAPDPGIKPGVACCRTSSDMSVTPR